MQTLSIPPNTQNILVPNNNDVDEINLRELFVTLWAGKWIILGTTILFTVVAITFAFLQPNIYKSDVLLASTASDGTGGALSQLASQYSGLANLAGVNLGSGSITQADLAIQVLQSRQFISQFIHKHHLLVPIMAADNWNLKTNKLILDKDIYDSKNKKWLRTPQGLHKAKPSDQEAYKKFTRNILSVNIDKDTGLYTISVSFYSPYLTKQWATWLVQDINNIMRDRTITETNKNLKYLKQQLATTSVADMQSTFFNLIEQQTKNQMLAKVQKEFVFKTIDPAISPEIKDEPKRLLIAMLGFLFGLVLGFSIIIVKFSLKKNN